MFDSDFIRQAIIAAPAILFALTVHEFFHAWTALKFGDTTARDMGRLTLNPLAHLDLFGHDKRVAGLFQFDSHLSPGRFPHPQEYPAGGIAEVY